MERDAFLARLRAAAAPAEAPASARRLGDAVLGKRAASKGAAAGRAELFTTRAQALGVTLCRMEGLDEARRAVEGLCAVRGWRTVACDPELRWPGLSDRFGDPRGAEFGLCAATAGIARTGSVVVVSGRGRPRSTSLLPPATGFILYARDVVDDLGDVLLDLDADAPFLPACVTFISGPSNTADIAGHLVTGAHGPTEVFVWLVGDVRPPSPD